MKITDEFMLKFDWFINGALVGVIVLTVVILLVGLLCGPANAEDVQGEIKCRDVPDSLVLRCLDRDALWGTDEWGKGVLLVEAKTCECPEGTRKKYSNAINASNPPSMWVSCWTVKTVCDTIWAKP